MIYHFKITSPESENFHLEMELDARHTFFDLHAYIQNSLGYESFQLASFFIPGKYGQKEKEVSLLGTGSNESIYLVMHKTYLNKVIGLHQPQLIYTFDFINDRSLKIELTGIVMERNLKEPTVTLNGGVAPVQVLEEASLVSESVKNHDDEVFMDFGILNDYTELYGEMEDY